MLVNELKEELNQPLTNMEVKVEIGGQKSYAGSAYIDKGGCLVITDSLHSDAHSFKHKESIRKHMIDLRNDLDYLEEECERASRKMDAILDLLER